MTAQELYDLLKKLRNRRLLFNKDKKWVLSILQDLLVNKERYGYSSCPVAWHQETGKKTVILYAPCACRSEDVKNTAAVSAISMFQRAGMTIRFPINMCPRRPPDKVFF